ncbi:hypothetical protein FA95DRAFT_1611342 [Auriscalpium vulgare]|uniref:Uncharacterized protein n=1 Tax=Auriscalpium vulgare TaxID=40419 RepID=A0ACB8RAY0_9AGAM|nr:hypothetical protein FA95DRAFT_1611342 [Auriscalpium vulgare]
MSNEPLGRVRPPPPPPRPLQVGIVGGGMAGLYAGLLLQREGHHVRIFEGTSRVGGRVRTHHFSHEDNQYFEAGAMRIPESDFHEITFNLIKYLQSYKTTDDRKIRLIPYIITAPGNRLYVNGVPGNGFRASAVTRPRDINWIVPPKYENQTADDLMMDAIGPFIKDLQNDFDRGFEKLLQFDDFSFRFYLTSVKNYPPEVVDFIETVASQTNQFALSVPEMVMQYMDFDTQNWWTVDKGMNRLPYAMAYLLGYKNITYGARVVSLTNEWNGQVTVGVSGFNGLLYSSFDKVILAIPPAALKMIAERPRWNTDKELAVRSMHFEALYKMGMRFKTRFWERIAAKPTAGGQSTTDLPIRWIVYPSNGVPLKNSPPDSGPGVLLVYAWMTDATTWLPLTAIERRSLALHCLAELYNGEKDKDGSTIDVYDLLIGTSDAVWSTKTATGDAMFLPGQFKTRFEPARRSEGNIYFAGEHLSRHHTWISGALDSALYTVRQVLGKTVQPLKAVRSPFECVGGEPLENFNPVTGEPVHGIPHPGPDWLHPIVLGSRDGDNAVPATKFIFKPKDALYGEKSRWGVVEGDTQEVNANRFPLDMGGDPLHPLGVELTQLDGPHGSSSRIPGRD